MMHVFTRGSKRALLHLMSLSLLSIHAPHPLYGNQLEEQAISPYDQGDQISETNGWYATQQGQTEYVNQPHMNYAEQAGYAASQAHFAAEQANNAARQANYATEEVDYSNCWQDPSIECKDPRYCQNENANQVLEQSNDQNLAPCQTTAQAEALAQDKCEEKADACNASAYAQAKKVSKLRPITVVVGLLIVGALAVTLMNNSRHQHTHECRPCKRGCR